MERDRRGPTYRIRFASMMVSAASIVCAATISAAFDPVPGECYPFIGSVGIIYDPDVSNNTVDLGADGGATCVEQEKLVNCSFCSELSIYEFNPVTSKYDIEVAKHKQSFPVDCGDGINFQTHKLDNVAMIKGKSYRGRHSIWKTSCDKAGAKADETIPKDWTW